MTAISFPFRDNHIDYLLFKLVTTVTSDSSIIDDSPFPSYPSLCSTSTVQMSFSILSSVKSAMTAPKQSIIAAPVEGKKWDSRFSHAVPHGKWI